MKKIFIVITSLSVLAACGGKTEDAKKEEAGKENASETKEETVKSAESTETPESIAANWCKLNGIAHFATTPEEKEDAEDALDNFEEDMENKYKDDKAMMDKIEEAVEACEASSEGR